MTIANGSFETQATGAQPGAADSWSLAETYTGEEYAEFTVSITGAGTRTAGQDGFEGEWPTGFSDGLLGAFEGYFVDIEPLFFDASGSSPEAVENFETLWESAPQGVFYLQTVPTEDATFDTGEAASETVEDFEEGWPTTGAVLNPGFDGSELEEADFKTGAGTVEDFEAEWAGHPYNWSYPIAGPGSELAFAYFKADPANQNQWEPFEDVRFDLDDVTVDPSTDTFTKASHGLTDLWLITFRNEGGRLPAGINTSTEYYVRNSATNTFQISATKTSPVIDITDYGFGEHFVVHDDTYWWPEELDF